MIRYAAGSPKQTPLIIRGTVSTADRLASDMREMAFAHENVTPETLALRGWDEDVVAANRVEAVKIATKSSIRRVA